MHQQDEPDNFALGTGIPHTIKEFVYEAFDYVELDFRKFVRTDPIYMRPLEENCLIADPSKAKNKLNLTLRFTFNQLVPIIVDAEISIDKNN